MPRTDPKIERRSESSGTATTAVRYLDDPKRGILPIHLLTHTQCCWGSEDGALSWPLDRRWAVGSSGCSTLCCGRSTCTLRPGDFSWPKCGGRAAVPSGLHVHIWRCSPRRALTEMIYLPSSSSPPQVGGLRRDVVTDIHEVVPNPSTTQCVSSAQSTLWAEPHTQWEALSLTPTARVVAVRASLP